MMTYKKTAHLERGVATLTALKNTMRRSEDRRVRNILTDAIRDLKRALPEKENSHDVDRDSADHPRGDSGRRITVLKATDDFVLDTLRRS